MTAWFRLKTRTRLTNQYAPGNAIEETAPTKPPGLSRVRSASSRMAIDTSDRKAKPTSPKR